MSSTKENKCEKTLNSIKLRESQDSRLTSRHISTLMKLDDLTLENEKLKTKVDLMEKEFGSCLELHDIARNAKQKFADLTDEYDNKIKILVKEQNGHIKWLEESYNSELVKCLKDSNNEKENLVEQLEQAKVRNKSLEKENNSMLDNYEQLLLTNSELVQTATEENTEKESNEFEFTAVENKTKLLENELSLLKKGNSELINDKNCLESDMKALKSEIVHLKVIKESPLPDVNKIPSNELDEMSSQLKTIMIESQKYNDELQELKLKELKRDELFNDFHKRIELYEMERKILHQTSNDQSLEIVHLKEQLKKLQQQQRKSQSLPNSPTPKYMLTNASSNEDMKPLGRSSTQSATGRLRGRNNIQSTLAKSSTSKTSLTSAKKAGISTVKTKGNYFP